MNEAAWLEKRFAGIERPYSKQEVTRLRGSFQARLHDCNDGRQTPVGTPSHGGVRRLPRRADGQHGRAACTRGPESHLPLGLAGCSRRSTRGRMYPDQSLYPVDSVPTVVRRINQALLRSDQIRSLLKRQATRHWLAPIMADAEAGFGGPLNAYELMKSMIEAGAAGVHFED